MSMQAARFSDCALRDLLDAQDSLQHRSVKECSIKNKLLLTLRGSELDSIAPLLSRVPIRPRQILIEPSVPVRDVYFIEQGIAVIMSRSSQPRPIELSMVGRLGLVGLPIILGTNRAPFRCVVQIGGTALKMKAADVQSAMQQHSRFRQLMMSYVQARMVQQAQITVCNTWHRVSQRVARWLLMAGDRVEGPAIPVTHDLLGRMLGIRRAGITGVISDMECRGILRRGRGQVTIVDRDKLLDAACDCYSLIRREYDRMILDSGEVRDTLRLAKHAGTAHNGRIIGAHEQAGNQISRVSRTSMN
jgi:CRP-like cAMP-binding protein